MSQWVLMCGIESLCFFEVVDDWANFPNGGWGSGDCFLEIKREPDRERSDRWEPRLIFLIWIGLISPRGTLKALRTTMSSNSSCQRPPMLNPNPNPNTIKYCRHRTKDKQSMRCHASGVTIAEPLCDRSGVVAANCQLLSQCEDLQLP